MPKRILIILKCIRCDWQWPQRGKEPPKLCAKCRTTLWNMPRQKPPKGRE